MSIVWVRVPVLAYVCSSKTVNHYCFVLPFMVLKAIGPVCCKRTHYTCQYIRQWDLRYCPNVYQKQQTCESLSSIGRRRCVLSDAWFRDLKILILMSRNLFQNIIWVRNCFFLKNYATSEGAVSHNLLYFQQLSITRYQVSCYAKNYLG